MSATPSTEHGTAVAAPPASFWQIARRPRWIGALLLALAVAAGFAALGQWQIGRAVETAVQTGPDTETAVPLTRIATPQTGVTAQQGGRIVTVSGHLVPGDTVLLSGRLRVGTDSSALGGDRGWWVVGHLVDAKGRSLPVALGFAADRGEAVAARRAVTDAPVSLRGRYLPSESPDEDDLESGQHSALAVASLVNEWAKPGPVYGGYLVPRAPADGLREIIAPAPEQQGQLNLLNIFYALEWAVFAGFAVYLWYRLVRDQQEKEQVEAADAAAAAGGALSGPNVD